MALTVKDIIDMKNHTNNLGINVYDWFFNDLENNHISKMNGTERNVSILKGYNEEAQAYIIQQLYYLDARAATELMNKMEIKEPFVSTENAKHIIKY